MNGAIGTLGSRMTVYSTTRAIIQLDNLRHNLSVVRTLIGPQRKICLAVKANAYGHGLVEIAHAAVGWGVDSLCVVNVLEGMDIRRAGITCPVILITQPLPDEVPALLESDIIPMVGNSEIIECIEREARYRAKRCTVHLKVDTGMGRNGCGPDEAVELAMRITDSPNLLLAGTATHFPISDTPDDHGYTKKQVAWFVRVLDNLWASGIDPGTVHAANSGAIINHPEAYFDMVRVGIMAYGYVGNSVQEEDATLASVMTLESRVILKKRCTKGTTISYGVTYSTPEETDIAVVRIGYGDGYRRSLSNNSDVMIRGRRYPVVGRVCMDHLMVNLGRDNNVSVNDPVVLFGSRSEGITAQHLAEKAGTIVNEVLTGITQRVPRIYREGDPSVTSSGEEKQALKH